MQAGRLDRRVTLLARSAVVEDDYGTQSVQWLPLATVWAELQDMLPSRAERIAEGIEIARRPVRVRLRWRDDVGTAERLGLDDGRQLRIVAGPAEIFGRRHMIELVAEHLTTEGEEP